MGKYFPILLFNPTISVLCGALACSGSHFYERTVKLPAVDLFLQIDKVHHDLRTFIQNEIVFYLGLWLALFPQWFSLES